MKKKKKKTKLILKLCQEVVDTNLPSQEPKIILIKCAHQLTVINLLGRNFRLFALSVKYTKLFSAELKVI